MSAELVAQVKSVLADVLGVPARELTDDATPDSVAAWDSVMHVSVVMALEAQFDVSFRPEEVPELVSIPAIVTMLTAKRG
jgi:acyl carrier protein